MSKLAISLNHPNAPYLNNKRMCTVLLSLIRMTVKATKATTSWKRRLKKKTVHLTKSGHFFLKESRWRVHRQTSEITACWSLCNTLITTVCSLIEGLTMARPVSFRATLLDLCRPSIQRKVQAEDCSTRAKWESEFISMLNLQETETAS